MILAALACDRAGEAPVDSEDSASDTSTPGTGCVGGGFGDPHTWELPTLTCEAEVADLDGDGRLDLVDPCTWTVHAGLGNGFAEGVAWGMPDGSFPGLEAEADCAAGQPGFEVTDLTGDGRRDLVVRRACDDDAVGTDWWRVHVGSGEGFGATPASWRLPDHGAGAFTGESACPAWTLADLTGDGRPDLVVTDDCEGATWLVYPNSGSGFSPTGSAWTGPETTAELRLVDGDGDERADLVVAGDGGWTVYRSDGTDFTEGVPWDLPVGLSGFAGTLACDSNRAAWDWRDLTGDGVGDVVVYDTCDDDGVGSSEWRVHGGTGGGFAGAASWAIPGPFAAPSGAGCPTWFTEDAGGDGYRDLVVTDDCSGEAAWTVYAGGCRG